MKYQEALDWINGFQQFGMNLGLERIEILLKTLDNPEQSLDIIHVAGTNGKGSVCRYLLSILAEEGYTVGMTTSPHLETILERFNINNKNITKKEFVSTITKVKDAVEKIRKNGVHPTYFEICTAIAFQYFKDRKVDYAIIEVGLGGTYDATNVVTPLVSVITNISFDHQHILGKSIKKIAMEKAGIIKPNIPVVTGAETEALNIIASVAEKNHCPIYKTTDEDINILQRCIEGQTIEIKGELQSYTLDIQDIATYQVKNLALAIKTIDVLQINGVYIAEESIVNGVKSVMHPGRMNIIQKDPIVIIDGAHNPAGITELKNTIQHYFTDKKIILLFGALVDKNIKKMMKTIHQIPDTIIVTKSTNERAENPEKIKEIILEQNDSKNVIVTNSVHDAIQQGFNQASSDDTIIITGSLYTVQEALSYFKNKNN